MAFAFAHMELVTPGRDAVANPGSSFPHGAMVDSGFRALRGPGMTSEQGLMR